MVKKRLTDRQNEILDLINDHSFLTVAKIAELTYTSESSVRRDLARLESLYCIRRTHGGACALDDVNRPAKLDDRMNKNTLAKRVIAKKAAAMLSDGQSIMLDSSTTAGFLIPHIAKLRDVTVFTNNMITAVNAVNFSIDTHCLGGHAIGGNAVLSGEDTYAAISRLRPDILFFSSQCIDRDGLITDPTPEENYARRLMLESARKRVFLCDSGKFGSRSLYVLTSVEDIDVCVFDAPWDDFRGKCEVK